ncbi:MAG TPA: ATP-dependent Clp protease proteolytic subunit, partial [Polyangiaceae bacterium]
MIPFRRHCAALMAALATALASSFAAAAVYVHIEVEGVINPVKARYVERALRRAEAEHAGFLLLTLNTPGGLVSSMEVITRAFANAPLPVVGYVEPRTAQATSAGALILLSTDIAAMAPNTRVGAAHPVDTEGKQLQGPMNDKATNSMVALAKSLLARRKRPEAVADAIVRKSESFTASEAKEQGIIEIIAADRAGLLAALDGRRVEMAKREVTLHTRGARAVELPLTFTERTLDVLAEPTIATMLLSIGVLSVLYELSSPGIGMAGMVGIVSILVGLVGLSLLPVR